MKRILYITVISLVILASCKDESSESKSATDSVIEDSLVADDIDTVLSNETISFLNTAPLSSIAKSKAPNFSWSRFRMTNSWTADSLYTSPFEPSPDYYDRYKPLLKYSPDSTMFIDLDSYNLSIEKDKNGKLFGSEAGPDTEVSLVNVNDRKKTRLVFLGPGSSIEDGSWIDRENLVLMGFQETGDSGTRLPVIWRYHVPTSTFYIYEMPDPKVAKQLMGQWRRERLKGLTIR